MSPIFVRRETGIPSFDGPAFSRYYQGHKVRQQNHNILRELLSIGKAEEAEMTALSEMDSRLPKREGSE